MELADKLYTSTQVADILGVSLRTLYRYMEDNKIKSMRTASGRHRFTKDHIIEFLNAGRDSMYEDEMARNSERRNVSPFQNRRYDAPYSDASHGQQRLDRPEERREDATYHAESRVEYRETEIKPRVTDEELRYSNFQERQNVLTQQPSDIEEDLIPEKNNEQIAEEEKDDFEFDVMDYDYDKPSPVKSTDVEEERIQNHQNNNFNNRESQKFEERQYERASVNTGVYAQSPFTPPANISAREEAQPESTDLGINLNIRYYKSDYTDLIELAKKIKDTANSKDLEYAFTLFAGLSLHFFIRPFTMLHFYANPEDMQLWKDELRLVPSPKREDANIGIIINTDIVFVPTKEIGGFKVVEDKVLLKDLSAAKEEDLVKQFRQRLTTF